jgi:DNA-binding transcriptional LysR family regulator
MMTFKQLEAFYAAAMASSFAVAAMQLHLSQSSLSKRLGELESDLGTLLFDRSGHRSVLTPAGEALLPLARNMLDAARHARETVGKNTGLNGVCRFGVGELGAVTWLPKFVARCRRDFPDLRLEPHVDVGQSLEKQLESGELDFAVVAGWSSRNTIASHTIADVQYSWVGTDMQLGGVDVLTPESLKEMTIITMPHSAGSTRLFEAWMLDNKLTISRQLICNNMGAIAGMVAAGIGIAFFPNSWVRSLKGRHGLRTVLSHPPLRSLQYSFQSQREDIRPLITAMRERIVQEVDYELPHAMW